MNFVAAKSFTDSWCSVLCSVSLATGLAGCGGGGSGVTTAELAAAPSDGSRSTASAVQSAPASVAAPLKGLAGKCLDVVGNNQTAGTRVQLYSCNGTESQQWAFDGTQFKTAAGLCLDVSGGLTSNGADIIVWTCHGGQNQQWNLTGGQLKSAASGKCLDVYALNTADEARVTLWDCNGGANQQWSSDGPPAPGIPTVAGLLEAATRAKPGDTLTLAAGTFELLQALKIPSGVSLRGAGAGKTIITNASSFSPGNAGLDNDEGASLNGVDCSKYLINLGRDTTDFSVTELTLTGNNIPGGICGIAIKNVTLSKLEFKSFLWAGARLFIVENLKATDNTFFDAGNKSNVTSGSSGGALFLTYFGQSDIANNRFSRSVGNDGYGIKGREARKVRIHHNTIDVFFSIELPFESDHFVEIDHNFLGGAVSLPKYAGGTFPDGGYSFHIHHNYFNTPYALEFQRNGIEVDHNLFDFPTAQDYGNLIAGFDAVPAPGGLKMHNNLISNPGRGIYWNEGVYNNFAFYNNHVRGQTTVTPRTEGLFDFRIERGGVRTDFSTIFIRDNIFELTGIQRPLMRNSASYAAVISNNTLTGISDTASYANPNTGEQRGLTEPLCFRLGAYSSLTVKDWTLSPSPSPVPNERCSP